MGNFDNSRYSVQIEKNRADKKFTEEITMYYDGLNNIGVSHHTYDGQSLKTFSYFNDDQLLITKGI